MLKYRIISGVTMGAILLTAIFVKGFIGAFAFIILNTVFLAGGLTEFFNMTEKIGLKGYTKMTIILGLCCLYSMVIPPMLGYRNHLPFVEMLTIIYLIIGFLRVFNEDHKIGLTRLFVSLAGLVYIAWTLTFIAKIYFISGLEMNGRYLVLYLIAVTKFSDIGAFIVGSLSNKILKGGNHKIAPNLSPGKSWEGFVGGIIFSIAVALLLKEYFGEKLSLNGNIVIDNMVAIVSGAVFATLGFVGDVAESALKRASGAKDSGKTIPGMGGVLDVVDSLTLVSPIFYCLLVMAQ